MPRESHDEMPGESNSSDLAVRKVRRTPSVGLVLDVFIDQPSRAFYGFELMQASRLSSATMYTVLKRLSDANWLKSSWEDADTAHAEGRPPRRYYRLTGAGYVQAIADRDAENALRSAATRALRARPAGGFA